MNERVRDANRSFSVPTEYGDFVCECGDASCIEQIRLTMDEYRAIRSEPTLFAIVPGHDLPDVEDVVERHDRFDVVRKREGEAAELARELDS